jgi:CHAT domain-containing protein
MWKTYEKPCLRLRSEVFLGVRSIGTPRNTELRSRPHLRICFAALLFFGVFLRGDSKSTKTNGTEGIASGSSDALKALRARAFDAYSKQNYEEAIQRYLEARKQAIQEGNRGLAIFFLNNVAGSYFRLAAFQDAVKYFEKAQSEARDQKLPELESMAAYNLASIQLVLGREHEALRVVSKFPLDGSTLNRDAKLDGFLLQANIFTRLKREQDARDAIARALQEADLDPPATLKAAHSKKLQSWPESLRELRRAWVFSVLSQCLVRLEKFEEAEQYTLESYRLRAVFQDKARLMEVLQYGILLNHRGAHESARNMLQAARQIDPSNRTPIHHFLIDREIAKAHLAENNFAAAVPFLRASLEQARRWRMQVLPTDSAYLNFESYLTTEVHKAFLNAVASPTFSLNQKGLAEETFWVAEEARFASMRAAQFPKEVFASRFPPIYWQQLSRYQSLQAASLRGEPSNQKELAIIADELEKLELDAGLSIPNSSEGGEIGVQKWIQGIKEDEIVLSYALGDRYSLAWMVDSKSVQVRRIAGREKLIPLIEQFRREILDPSQNGPTRSGMELSRELFGDILLTKRTTPFWTMVLDQELNTIPIAALPTSGSRNHYLVLDHTIRVMPSALYLGRGKSGTWHKTSFAIGDPVYNEADVRGRSQGNALLELNRLPGALNEVSQVTKVLSAQGWATTSSTGFEASPSCMRQVLASSPDILHVATHFVHNENDANPTSIALSPDKGKYGASLFNSLDLNGVRTGTKLVVLSGCGSSRGKFVPSIGLNGLARGFLISGAEVVVGTLWETLDSEGPMFEVFYRNLTSGVWSSRAAALALRDAQTHLIRSGGWSGHPSYWATFLAISKG